MHQESVNRERGLRLACMRRVSRSCLGRVWYHNMDEDSISYPMSGTICLGLDVSYHNMLHLLVLSQRLLNRMLIHHSESSDTSLQVGCNNGIGV